MAVDIEKREFITGLGSAAVAWPLPARAQQGEPMRRIGMLMNRAADDSEGQAQIAAFQQTLKQSGWSDGRNVRFDIRWSENDVDRDRKYAAELVALAPDVILAAGTLSVAALQRVTRTLPIVFVTVSDPVGAGLVDTLARPGGNITGFMLFEYSLSGKWLELLKQIAPSVTRAAVLRDAANPAGIGQFGAIQGAAQSLGVEVSPVSIRDAAEIERAVAAFARSANGGLIVTPSAGTSVHRDLIITLAARYKLPAVYAQRSNVSGGGLICYAPDEIDQFRRAAGYVDRVLKGEKPADLPVQAPTKLELVINLKTAKALNLTIPASVLARADAVIE
jgi:putative tryptophan/tyrosine transport system substrate-binding protein